MLCAEWCRLLAGCSKRDAQRAMWWQIASANAAYKRQLAQLLVKQQKKME